MLFTARAASFVTAIARRIRVRNHSIKSIQSAHIPDPDENMARHERTRLSGDLTGEGS